ncbi:hypothetical protein RND71_011827 [Anisodus tanguticus]|uniref:U1 small nuclear ribonucleoprotein of 70kDa N-terminal domain-containing protein n=1 Tax=Anisodus tanguticus TaxID=243964 RepID=A0AAE1VQ64_9SOLA|nr:hypothetical protein RND71_011827 [Anisodus tanguticus]
MGDFNDAFMRNNPNVQARAKAQNRANVMQLKLCMQIGQSHPTGLTANLLKLFEPRPPLEYKPPPEKRKCPSYTGMAQFVSNFAQPGDPEYAPPIPEVETPAERRARIHKLRLEEGAKKAAEELEKYDPSSDPNVTGDPYKTLFVARLNYETTESRVKREFEAFGPIKRLHINKLMERRLIIEECWLMLNVGEQSPIGVPADLAVDLEQQELEMKIEIVQPGRAASRSEEPRARDDRDRDREKSRERVRDRDREKSCERSHDRPRERDRDDKHHRERERTREREKDRGRDRDRDRERDRTHDHERGKDRDRDRDRERDRHREKDRERGRDYEGEVDKGRGLSRDREYDYEHVESKHERERHGDKERNYDHAEPEDDHGHYDYYDHQGRGDYENPDAQGGDDRYKDATRGHDQMEEDNYAYDRGASEPKERDRDYKRSDRSHSQGLEAMASHWQNRHECWHGPGRWQQGRDTCARRRHRVGKKKKENAAKCWGEAKKLRQRQITLEAHD